MESSESRKQDHIDLTRKSQVMLNEQDCRFDYEPLFSAHPRNPDNLELTFLNKKIKAPIWVSSMTGGTNHARTINQRLAKACGKFGLGMGLGSCRSLLNSNEFLEDFKMRKWIGDEHPFYANLGIAQVEELVLSNDINKINDLISRLEADGLIIHLNPLQEWFQPEGDRLKQSALETLEMLIEKFSYPLIIKEVGQGIGPRSLEKLLMMPIAAIEFGAFGGTNFSKLEKLRGTDQQENPMVNVGHGAQEMLLAVNKVVNENKDKILCENIIISGGIRSFLTGYELTQKSLLPAVYGQAAPFLKYALEGEESLDNYITKELEGLSMAYEFLKVKQ